MALQTIPYDFTDVVLAAPSSIEVVTGPCFFALPGTKSGVAGRRFRKLPFASGTVALRGPAIVDVIAYVESNIPIAPAPGDWSIADGVTALRATVTIVNIPTTNGGTLWRFEWSNDAGATWTPLVRITAGTEDIVLANGAHNVLLRLVTRQGEGNWSVAKPVTVS